MRLPTTIERVKQFVSDESGQDLIEYGLLGALIGTVGILAWTNIRVSLGSAYSGWGSGVNTLSGCTPDPIGTPGGNFCTGGS
jgi:Flp pilus assembly pilin Flp